MQKVIILGTGGNCVDILDTLLDVNDAAGQERFSPVGFLDDDPARHGQRICGVPVLGPLASAGERSGCLFVNGIGSPANFYKKPQIIGKTGLPRDRFVTVVHPTASVSRFATLGAGTVVLQNVTVASNVAIGDHVIVLPNTVISHDDVIGDYTAIAGGVNVSGGVTVGQACYLGTGASIVGGVTIGDRALVGMGSVVLGDVEEGTVVVGSPARVLRRVGR